MSRGHSTPPKRLKPRCAAPNCPHRVKQWHNKHCSKRCAWLVRKGWEMGARGRAKALLVNRQKYAARLRERLRGMTTVAQIWKAAYLAGYRSGYATWLRKVQRGEVINLRERRDREVA